MSNAATQQSTETFTKGEFKPIPAADYLVRMTSIEEKKTRKGDGLMVRATFQVVNGDYKNRLIFEQFLVEHPKEIVQKIGNERLDNYLKAVGVSGGQEDLGHDRTQLENYLELPFIASVKIQEGNEYKNKDGQTVMGKDSNKVSSFKSR